MMVRPPAVAGTFYPATAARRSTRSSPQLLGAVTAPRGPMPEGTDRSARRATSTRGRSRRARSRASRRTAIASRASCSSGPRIACSSTGSRRPARDRLAHAARRDRGRCRALASWRRREPGRARARALARGRAAVPPARAAARARSSRCAARARRPTRSARVLETLWGGPETLIVISSDLSHYLPYAEGRALDEATARADPRARCRPSRASTRAARSASTACSWVARSKRHARRARRSAQLGRHRRHARRGRRLRRVRILRGAR